MEFNYWIGTNDQGIIVYNPKTHEQTAHYTIQNSNLSSSIMVGSMCASDGTIWFGSYNGGLVHCIPSKANPSEATIINYRSTGLLTDWLSTACGVLRKTAGIASGWLRWVVACRC